MNEECLICKAPLVYLDADEVMECQLCHKKQNSKTRCVNGHFVCDDCHTSGMDENVSICFGSKSVNPIEIMEKNDVYAVLPYARAGTSCYGWLCPFNCL